VSAIEAVTADGEILPWSERGVPGEILEVGWRATHELSIEEWRTAGRLLGRLQKSVMWCVGDWWAYGENRYGERKTIVTAPDWDGPDYQTCRNAGSVCRTFETSRRRDVLGFAHHAEVAGLEMEEAEELLDWAEETVADGGKPRSTRELRSEVAKRRNVVGALPSSGTCTIADLQDLAAADAKFGCIYADPPWIYDNQATRAATGNHYDGLTVDQLCELPVRDLAADDAHLHLWTTNAFLFDTPRIFKAWGFEFRSSFVWVKPQMGIGNYWRNSHEFLLTAIRGDAKRFNDRGLMSWLECARGQHSAKPEQVRSFLERASPGPRLEMFARTVAPGWTSWGNQIDRCLFAPREAA
jgi:N6-adenosine-specific RNA methylase IME4